ncbi:MAG: hypothetical protein UHM08_09180 [Bacteroidales bacterium]|nr:hypothetical protein [Bacteroidales bacterium]
MAREIYNEYTNNLSNYIQDALIAFAHKFQTCIPAIVKKVESRDTVVVSPAVLQTNSDGLPVKWSDITTTVLTPFSSGMFLSMPVSVGDTGWLVGADLDTDKFKQTKSPAQQTVFTRHQYQFGFFVPDAINGYTVSEDDSGAWVLSTLDGKTKITIKDKEINLISDTDLKINAKNVNITGSNNVTINNIDFVNHVHSGGTLSNSAGTVTGFSGNAQNLV